VKTWRGRPATNSSGSDNLLAGVWALVSCKYSLFGVQHSSGHSRPDRSRLCRLEIQKPRTILASASGMSCGTEGGLGCILAAVSPPSVEQTVEQNSPDAARQRQRLPTTARLTC